MKLSWKKERVRETTNPCFDQMGPVNDSNCNGVTQWGTGDEAKFVCNTLLAELATRSSCTIVSLGSLGVWTFEEDAFANTNCEIHTFDCTGSWWPPLYTIWRVHFHELCVGPPNNQLVQLENYEEYFIEWSSLVNLVGGQVDYLKMDIEGTEGILLPLITSGNIKPAQIQVEIHNSNQSACNTTQDILAPLSHAVNAAYNIVYRRDNPYCPICSEMLLVDSRLKFR